MATKKDVTTTATTTTKADVKSAATTAPVKTETKAVPAKTETKAASTAKTEVKADAKKETAAKKATAAKRTTTKTAAKKTTAKAGRKTTRKTAAKAVKENVFEIQYDELDITQAEIMEKVRAVLSEQGAKPAGLKNVDVYVQPKNNVAYYVSNAGKASEIKGEISLS